MLPRNIQHLPIYDAFGLGVEGVTKVLKWIEEPQSRNFPLSQLTLYTAQTGDEHDDTRQAIEELIMPRVRAHNIRWVQIARAGEYEEDGIVILDDTTQPTTLFTEGCYKLSDHLLLSGTVPQFAGEHLCSLKFKVWVAEEWLGQELAGSPFIQSFGFNADETRRIDRSEEANRRRNEALGYVQSFGFNRDEETRIARARTYDTPPRHGYYPLSREHWNMTREDCKRYNEQVTGYTFEKSACVYCPFRQLTPNAVARLGRLPKQTAYALFVEYVSRSMNPRGRLYRARSLWSVVNEHGHHQAIRLLEEYLNEHTWSIYRVRRIYSAKGKAVRAVEQLETTTRARALRLFASRTRGMEKVTIEGVTYAYKRRLDTDIYPAFEEFFVAAPSRVKTKARAGIPRFDEKWARLTGDDPTILLPGQSREGQTTLFKPPPDERIDALEF